MPRSTCRTAVAEVALSVSIMMKIDVGESGVFSLKVKIDLSGGAVAVLLDQQLGLVVNFLHLLLPILHSIVMLLLVFKTDLLWLTVLFVILVAINEHHQVGVLLDRTGLAQV